MTQSTAVSTMNGHDADEQRYTVVAAAELLQVKVGTIYDALSPAISSNAWDVTLRSIGKLNGRWLLPKSMLLAWNEARLANQGVSIETAEAPSPAPQSYIETSLDPQPLVTITEQEVMSHVIQMITERVQRRAEADLQMELARSARILDELRNLRTYLDTFIRTEEQWEQDANHTSSH